MRFFSYEVARSDIRCAWRIWIRRYYLTRPLLGKSESVPVRWREALSETLRPSGRLIVDLALELVLIIRQQPRDLDISSQDGANASPAIARTRSDEVNVLGKQDWP